MQYTIFAKTKVDDSVEGNSKVEIQVRSYTPAPLERLPISLDFPGPLEAKNFKATVEIDDKNVDFSRGVTGTINFENLGTQCLAVYGCLFRKEDISVGAPISKSSQSRLTQPLFTRTSS